MPLIETIQLKFKADLFSKSFENHSKNTKMTKKQL